MNENELNGSDYIVLFVVLLFMAIGVMTTVSFIANLLENKNETVNQDSVEYNNDTLYSVNGFDVFIDEQAGVVCWYQKEDFKGDTAISCLPISETRLDNSE